MWTASLRSARLSSRWIRVPHSLEKRRIRGKGLPAVSGYSLDNLLAAVGLYIRNNDLRTFFREELGGRFTHSRGATADPGDLSVQAFHNFGSSTSVWKYWIAAVF